MRRLFVTAFMVMTMALSVSLVHGGNQEEANRIAQNIHAAYPQYMVEVAYKNGKVRLRGEVANEMERQAIIQLVSKIPQVQTVSADSVVVSPNFDGAGNFDQNFESAYDAMNADSGIQMVSATQTLDAQTMPAVPAGSVSTNPFLSANGTQNSNPVLIAETAHNRFAGKEGYLASPAQNKQTSPIPPLVASNMMTAGNEFNMNSTLETAPIQTTVNYNNGMIDAGTYSPAPQGIPVAAGQNGQNGQPNLPNYAWPTTADYPNYAQVGYPKQYAAGAFPYIGPFYPYPQVPLGWRKVTMEWHDGYWWLDFNDGSVNGPFSPLFRQPTKYR